MEPHRYSLVSFHMDMMLLHYIVTLGDFMFGFQGRGRGRGGFRSHEDMADAFSAGMKAQEGRKK